MSTPNIRPFLFEGESTVRVIHRKGAPWFVAVDVCEALGIANPSQAVEGLDDDERGICSTYTLCGEQEMLIISESGLFTLILRCRDALKKGTLPHRFRRWVTGEVLPSLHRRHAQQTDESPTGAPPEALKVRLVAEARQTFGARASAELWFTLDLPVVPAMLQGTPQSDLFMRPTPPGPQASANP
jgi:prophage antirepressor-like protein